MSGLSTRSQRVLSLILVGLGVFGLVLAMTSVLFDDGSDVASNLIWGAILLIVGLGNLTTLSRSELPQRIRKWRSISVALVLILLSISLVLIGLGSGGFLIVVALMVSPLIFVGGAYSLIKLVRGDRS